MKTMKKAILIPACVTLLTATSEAALVLEFTEVGSDVVLSFSGSVDLTGSFSFDSTSDVIFFSTIDGTGLTIGAVASPTSVFVDNFQGTDLLTGSLTSGSFQGDLSGGFLTTGGFVIVNSDVSSSIQQDNTGNITTLDTTLLNFTQTFNTSFVASGLDTHAPNTLIDLWRVVGTTGTDNLIQFRVNTVPEPSSVALLAMGMVGLITRRSRKA